MIKAVFFDFDGVVVQSELLHYKSFIEVLAPYKISVSEERWYREFSGTGSRYILQTLLNEKSISIDFEDLLEKRKLIYSNYVKRGELSETNGLRDFLKILEKKGIRKAIVSGGHRTNIELVLSVLKLSDKFEFIITAEEVKSRKPSPDPYLFAAKKMSISPINCLGIEDSPAGCESVVNAGMKLVAVKSPAKVSGYLALINDFRNFPLELLE